MCSKLSAKHNNIQPGFYQKLKTHQQSKKPKAQNNAFIKWNKKKTNLPEMVASKVNETRKNPAFSSSGEIARESFLILTSFLIVTAFWCSTNGAG